MRIKLDQRWTKWLLELPESGMGYQRVDVQFADGRELNNVIVLNAEELEVPEDTARAEIKNIGLHVP